MESIIEDTKCMVNYQFVTRDGYKIDTVTNRNRVWLYYAMSKQRYKAFQLIRADLMNIYHNYNTEYLRENDYGGSINDISLWLNVGDERYLREVLSENIVTKLHMKFWNLIDDTDDFVEILFGMPYMEQFDDDYKEHCKQILQRGEIHTCDDKTIFDDMYNAVSMDVRYIPHRVTDPNGTVGFDLKMKYHDGKLGCFGMNDVDEFMNERLYGKFD